MKKLFTLIALLACVVSGAWAEDITSLPFSASFDSSIAPFDDGDIPTASGNYIGGYLRVTNTTSTAWFDSDTSTEGHQALNLASNQEITVSAQAYHGWNGSGKNCTVALVNDGGYTIASYTYNTSSCNITDVKLGGETASSFTAFNGQSRYSSTQSANGLTNNSRAYQYFKSDANYNPQITFKVSGSGSVSVRIQIGLTNVDKTFSTTLNTSSFSMNLAKIVITGGETNADRAIGIENLSVTSEINNDPAYTIDYVDGNSNQIQASTHNTGKVGTVVPVSKSPIWVGTKKYIYVSDDSSTELIKADGSTVVTVTYREANVYNWTVKSNLNTVLGSGEYIEGEANVGINIPRFVLKDGDLYETAANYNISFAVTQNNQEEIVTYNKVAENIIAYSEVENIAGASSISYSNTVASLGSVARTTYSARPTIINLPAGIYELHTLAHAGNGTDKDTYNATFYKGDDLFATFSFKGRTNSQNYITTFSLDEATDIKFECPTGNSTGLDYIFIKALPTTVPVTISAAGYATFVPSYDVDFTDNAIEAYYVSDVNSTEGTVTLTQVNQVPAGEAVIVKGESGNVNVIASATAITNLMQVAINNVIYDENAEQINYVLAKPAGEAVGLYPVTSGTIAAGKGYLPVPKSVAVKGGLTFVTDDVTAANVVKAAPAAVKNGKFATADGIVIVKDGVKYNVAGMKK